MKQNRKSQINARFGSLASETPDFSFLKKNNEIRIFSMKMLRWFLLFILKTLKTIWRQLCSIMLVPAFFLCNLWYCKIHLVNLTIATRFKTVIVSVSKIYIENPDWCYHPTDKLPSKGGLNLMLVIEVPAFSLKNLEFHLFNWIFDVEKSRDHLFDLAWTRCSIAVGNSSGVHPVSSQSSSTYVLAGRPTFLRPCRGAHRIESLTSSCVDLQQRQAKCNVSEIAGRSP